MATEEQLAQYKEQGLFILVDKEGSPHGLVTLLDANMLWVHAPSLVFSLSYRVAVLTETFHLIGKMLPDDVVISLENARDPSLSARIALEVDHARITRRLEYAAAGSSGLDLMKTARAANEEEIARGRTGRAKVTPMDPETGDIRRRGPGKPSTPISEKLAQLYKESIGLPSGQPFKFYWNVTLMDEHGSKITRASNPTMGGPLKWYPSVPLVSSSRAGYERAVRHLFSQLARNPSILPFDPYISWAKQGPEVPDEIKEWIENTWPLNPMIPSISTVSKPLGSLPPSSDLGLPLPKTLGSKPPSDFGLPLPKTLGSKPPSDLGLPLPKTLGSKPPSDLGLPLPKTLGSKPPSDLGLPLPKTLGSKPSSDLGLPLPKTLGSKPQSEFGLHSRTLGSQPQSGIGASTKPLGSGVSILGQLSVPEAAVDKI